MFLQAEPFTTRQSDGTLVGLMPDIMSELGNIANFTYTLSMHPEPVFGIQQADGSWSGMIGQLIAGVRAGQVSWAG